jgi:hypothetical protein
MLGLHQKLGNMARIVADGEASIAANQIPFIHQILARFADMRKLTAGIIESKRAQFLSTSVAYYQTKSGLSP